jgi:hypothetical protein
VIGCIWKRITNYFYFFNKYKNNNIILPKKLWPRSGDISWILVIVAGHSMKASNVFLEISYKNAFNLKLPKQLLTGPRLRFWEQCNVNVRNYFSIFLCKLQRTCSNSWFEFVAVSLDKILRVKVTNNRKFRSKTILPKTWSTAINKTKFRSEVYFPTFRSLAPYHHSKYTKLLWGSKMLIYSRSAKTWSYSKVTDKCLLFYFYFRIENDVEDIFLP